MRTFTAVLALFLLVALSAALLVPHVAPFFPAVPLEKMLRHLGRLLLLLGFFFMIRPLGVNNPRDLGYETTGPRFLALMGGGWVAGLLLLGFLVVMLWLLDIRYYAPAGDPEAVGIRIATTLIGGAFVGFLIGFLEETFFRGMVYSALRKESGIAAAVVLSSTIYAGMHFLVATPLPEGTALTWSSGLSLLPSVGGNLLDPRNLDSFIALFTAGALLALVREYSGNIALAVGLHAGWVTVIKLTKYLMDTNGSSGLLWLVGNYDGISGLLGATLLALTCLPLILMLQRRERGQSDA
ncbi:MAG: CPBP family intramembrane metalloprotease [Gammaproteobacteria bacterium]|nr:CPBP family intramembrane metalloprotease [Gammaproteobacteria bacterium]MBU1653964.1 CPBP family intramembrane metalloprotease [Gammaproteobacteria bacterium]MBU1961347.1 CPBP family intramembrane metalloprotease [Gammaproteobacteria bacterium]